MKKAIITLLLWATASLALYAREPNEMTVLDCYLRLPPDFLEGAPVSWLKRCPMVDEKAGYMRCIGDGAQPNFQVALYRHADGRPLLVVCQDQLMGNPARFLDFFDVNSAGQLQKLPRSIFPVEDADQNKGANWFFELRKGGAILVRDESSGKVNKVINWNGEKFVEEKEK